MAYLVSDKPVPPPRPRRAAAAPGAEQLGTAPTQPPKGLVGELVAERYKVEALLGVGGMGSVYRATHVHMRKTVALKVLHPEMTRLPEVVARFEREAIAASRIEHTNVAAATDFGRFADGTFYLVLEFVQGESLRERLARVRRLPIPLCLHIARQIASALSAAHAIGIVHRDLKPENVMLVSRSGFTDLVKVLDFGIAKVPIEGTTQGGITAIGTVLGTPAYMSPEQCAGRESDARSDLYSLGVILYEISNGRKPFESDDPLSLLSRHLAAAPDPMEADIPAPLASIINHLLEKDPDKRVQSADELIQLLDSAARQDAGRHWRGAWARAAWLQRTGALLAHAASKTRPALERSAAAALAAARKPLRVHRWTVPLAIPVAAALLVVGSGVALVTRNTAPSSAVPSASAVPPSVTHSVLPRGPKDDFRRQVERIEMLKVYERTERDWTLLARGYAELGDWQKCAQAYRSVLALRGSLKSDPLLLNDLLQAARDPEAQKVVLNLAQTVLGANGVELIWALWSDLKQQPDQQETADKLRKQLVILSRRASPALRSAIELDYYQTCPTLEGIVARAAKNADQRSLAALEALTKQTGCGPRQEYDCTPCVRSEGLLQSAIARARSTPAPALGTVE